MGKLTRDNLQEFCRTCLSNLREKEQQQLVKSAEEGNMRDAVATTAKSILTYNIHLLPNLRKLLVLFTSLDVGEDEDGQYPLSLCQLCYDKMIDFQEFRNLALRSAEVLYDIVNKGRSISIEELETSVPSSHKTSDHQKLLTSNALLEKSFTTPSQNNLCGSDAGDSLLEPVPTENSAQEKSIKTEPLEKTSVSEKSNSPFHYTMKIEIDSEYEEEERSTFYENNALGTNYDSIGDDADDEEYELRNGAANSSSEALNAASTSQPSRQRLTGMLRKRDRNKKSLKCPRCDKQVYKQVYLDAHIRGVHEGYEKPFICMECKKAFTRYNQLHVHIQSNHDFNQKYICDFDGCSAAFKMSSTLETHRKVVHISSTSPLSFGLEEVIKLHKAQLSKEMDMDHICQQCLKKYSSKRALSEHLKRHLQIKTHICKECGVAKVTRTELQTHMRTHQSNPEKFKCKYCPQEFKYKNSISRHVRTVHEGQRSFPCNYCSKRFATRNSQKGHERLHTGERPFTCEVCNRGFAQVEGLKSHMKNHDKNLRKHVCSFCSQRFITRKNLVDHEKRHQGDKPHICNTCNRGFFLHTDLLMHTKMHAEAKDNGSDNIAVKREIETNEEEGEDAEGTEPEAESEMLDCSSSQSST